MIKVNACGMGLLVILLAVTAGMGTREVLADGAGATSRLAGRVEVAAAGQAVADRPVLLKVTLTNTGKEAMHYWCGGPGAYPGAEHFSISVTRADGKAREAELTNGQYTMGSGPVVDIEPGAVVQIPVAIGALPVGVWSLRVGGVEDSYVDEKGATQVVWPAMATSAPLRIMVAQDARAVKEWDEKLLADARGEDQFAWHVTRQYQIHFVIDAMLGDLAGKDTDKALTAAEMLIMVNPLPASAEQVIEKTIAYQLKQEDTDANLHLQQELTGLAEQFPTDKMLDQVLAVANAPVDWPIFDESNQVRKDAVDTLRYFPQKRAKDELKGFLKIWRLHDSAQWAIDHPFPPEETGVATTRGVE